MAVPSDISVVVLSWNTKALLQACLASLREARDGLDLEVVVIDNGSEDGSADMVATEFPEVVLERNQDNRGYAIAVNQGIRRSRGRKVCLLGSDTRVRPGTLRALAEFLDANQDVGAVAPPLLDDDGTYQRACMRFPTLLTAIWWDTPLQSWWANSTELRRYQMKDWDHRGTREIDQPPGTCFMVPRTVIDEVGFMDERLWLFFNDVDWALRIRRAGYRIWYVETPGVFHRQSSSCSRYADFASEWHKNRIHFYKKHYHALGSLITKAVAVYVVLRECVRTKRHLPFGRAYWRQCRMLLGKGWAALTQ
ncbi:MAG: glycosyl transferase [Planctomycetes bacterium]|nr:glycosyl transferase [Planctomycetota bacterium]